MFHVARTRIPAPAAFSSGQMEKERARARDFFDPERPASQRRYDFHREYWDKARDPLFTLFRRKCAYCESQLPNIESLLIDHFRPTHNAKDFKGATLAAHYYWLAYDWDNLYAACESCQKSKATLFPVAKAGNRAVPETRGDELRLETALLLDPCTDFPEIHFGFLNSGKIVAAARKVKSDLGYKRAQATIQVLSLNRKDLMAGRAKAMEEALTGCRTVASRRFRVISETGAAMSRPARRITRLLTPWYPFLAARRWVILNFLEELGPYGRRLVDMVPALQGGKASADRTTRRRPPPGRQTAYITDVTIENFKSIHKLTLEFDASRGVKSVPPETTPAESPDAPVDAPVAPLMAGWKVLLGENGVGKSSILQAIGLALIGEHAAKNRGPNWDKLLRKPRGRRPRPKEGFVRVGLSTGDDIEMRFNARDCHFTSGQFGARTYLRGYGPTRNLPNTQAPASWKNVESMVRIDGLFDSNTRLCHADRWLAGLKPEARFDAAALALKDLLRLTPEDQIRKVTRRATKIEESRKEIRVDIGDTSVTLDELSDGYQSMIALAVDIMAGLPKGSTDFQSDTGIVLLDELGTHLHPKWRMWVVRSLQRAFPRIQFFGTTHEPLCLRGLAKGEVSVLERVGGVVEMIPEADLPDPASLRIDQLLTSRYFGMDSTIDPDVDREFQRYYLLLGKKPLTREEERELLALKTRIAAQPRALGYTRRDQLVYEVIDEYLAKQVKEKGAQKRSELRESTKRKVAELFGKVMLLDEAAR